MVAPPTRRAGRRLAYVPALDGLRAVAVLAVLAYHAEIGWATGGFLGVSVFFTLSGFLITTLLLTEHAGTGRIALGQFWLRRAKRLMPAALLTIVAITATAVWLGPEERGFRLDAFAALTNVANWRFVFSGNSYADLFATPSPFQHFWSLSIEEQFYVVFPLVVVGVLVASRGRRAALVAATALLATASALSMVLRDAMADPDRLYYGTDTRAFEFLAGAALALWLTRRSGTSSDTGHRVRRRTRRNIEIAGVPALVTVLGFFTTVTLHAPALYDGGLLCFAVLSVVVIRAALEPGTAVARVLSVEPLRLLGIISYGVYLLHWPVFLWLDSSRTGLDGWPLVSVQATVTILLAWASYRLVELPVRSGRFPFAGRPIRWWAAPAGAAVAVTVVFTMTISAPSSTTAFDRDLSPDEALAALRAEDATARGGMTRVLVVGDSVASSLAVGLAAWAEDSGAIKVADFGVPACAVVSGGEAALAGGPGSTECGDWNASRAEGVRIFRPDVVVMLTGPWDIVDRRLPTWESFHGLGENTFDEWLIDSYRSVVTQLSARGAHVAWLTAPCTADIPGPLFETGAFDTERLAYLNEEIVPEVDDAEPAMTAIDLFARVCPDRRAHDEVEGIAGGRPDGVHFSLDGAYALSQWLGPQLRELAGEPARKS